MASHTQGLPARTVCPQVKHPMWLLQAYACLQCPSSDSLPEALGFHRDACAVLHECKDWHPYWTSQCNMLLPCISACITPTNCQHACTAMATWTPGSLVTLELLHNFTPWGRSYCCTHPTGAGTWSLTAASAWRAQTHAAGLTCCCDSGMHAALLPGCTPALPRGAATDHWTVPARCAG